MPPRKRSAAQAGIAEQPTRTKRQASPTAAKSRPRRSLGIAEDQVPSSAAAISTKSGNTEAKALTNRAKKGQDVEFSPPSSSRAGKSKAPDTKSASTKSNDKVKANSTKATKPSGAKASKQADDDPKKEADKPSKTKATPKTGKNNEKKDDEQELFWLMKAEPESRIEKGVDVKFSIHDLEARSEPEPWDGVRNPSARNNMRAMKKGDLAFFYHSNCKVPGIVGIMEIVQEHSPDESAFDKSHPYYDEKSDRENPKWSVVHVKHRMTFSEMVPLKELQKHSKPGGALEDMQVLRMSRLSVSKVSKEQWEFILNEMAGVDPATLERDYIKGI